MTDEHKTQVNQEEEDRRIWDINPFKVKIELSQDKIRMREQTLHNGRIRVAKAMDITSGPPECAWLYVHAESRDGADIKLSPQQAEELRDALDACIEAWGEDVE